MLIIIDESGDPGFKPSSSSHFMLGALLFTDYKDAEILSKKVAKLRNHLGFKREFKFSSTSEKNKIKFFEEIKEVDFKFISVCINKKNIFDKILKSNPKEFYYYCLRSLLKNIKNEVHLIKIDNLGNNDFKFTCAEICKDFFPKAKIKFVKSSDDSLVQAADMFTGLCIKENLSKKDLINLDEEIREKTKVINI